MIKEPDENRVMSLEQWAGPAPTTVAVCFTDILGSTALCNSMGDRQWIEVLVKHCKKARSFICQYNCHEIKIIGDSFMVVFRTAVDALNFAMAFQEDTGHPLVKIRAGIHVGAVRIIDDDIYGGMVNYTSRVIGWVKDDGIALSNSAKEQLDAELGAHGSNTRFIRFTHKFKGYDQPQRLWRVNPDRWWQDRIRQAFPSVEELDKGGSANGYCLEPANLDDIEWISQLEAEVYSPQDAIPERVLKEWYAANPTGFSIIKTKDGERIGHLDILPLHKDFLGSLLEGKIKERELTGASLYSSSDREFIDNLYVESVIVRIQEPLVRAAAIHCLLSELEAVIARVCDPSVSANLYAIAASSAGERFMRQLGFDRIQAGEDRVDGHDLFAAKYADLVVNIATVLSE